jgi:hypothetical protein
VTFTELPRAIQFQLAAIGPLLFGMVCGFVLELNAAAYWAASVLGVIGGLLGGTEHAGLRPAACRGTVAGACFGLGIVIAHAVSDRPALAPLPSPAIALILITAAAGGGLAAAGARLISRR